jgi:uncharacterized protein YjbI with pentapeptide repeats
MKGVKMPRIKIILLGLFAILIAFSSAQDDYIDRPFTFTFFPPVSTNGMEFWKVRTKFSLSIIGGAVGQLDGLELASVFSIEKDMARGVQVSGVFNLIGNSFEGIHMTGGANIVGKKLKGLQMAGGVNIVGEIGKGIQLAGGVNIIGKALEGIQIAGGANIVGENCKGVQIAGGANIIGEMSEGIQISGGANIVGENMKGIQITGGVNITGNEFNGLQMAPVNIAKSVKGFQLGVVNISEEMDGEALGVITITKNGQVHINAWTDEVAPINLGFKLGTKRIYNLYGLGMKSSGDSTYIIFNGGLGWHQPLNQFFLNFEVTGGPIRRRFSFRNWENTRLSRLRIIGGWQVIPKLAITAGPTINVYYSKERDGSDLPIYDATIYSTHSGNWWVRIWPGFAAGIQIF